MLFNATSFTNHSKEPNWDGKLDLSNYLDPLDRLRSRSAACRPEESVFYTHSSSYCSPLGFKKTQSRRAGSKKDSSNMCFRDMPRLTINSFHLKRNGHKFSYKCSLIFSQFYRTVELNSLVISFSINNNIIISLSLRIILFTNQFI